MTPEQLIDDELVLAQSEQHRMRDRVKVLQMLKARIRAEEAKVEEQRAFVQRRQDEARAARAEQEKNCQPNTRHCKAERTL